jgi:Ca2+-transporting ATPase
MAVMRTGEMQERGQHGVWHASAPDQVLALLHSSAQGLSRAEAETRLRRHGPNEMRLAPPVSMAALLLAQFRSLVVLLLAAAALLALLVGDRADALAIAAVLLINTALGFFTELRARRALHALLRIDITHATVVRDGRAQDLDARMLVPGDVIQLEAGQHVPADARLLNTLELQVIEAPLTGESIPVSKDAAVVLDAATPLAERANVVYKATAVASGRARAIVFATGSETEVGRLGGLASALPDEKTPLERKLDQLGRRMALLSLAAAALVAVVGLLRGMALDQVLETAVALAVAAVPEGLPAVATITLAIGVHRMARRNAIVRRLPSVETLGAVTVICTDKTGTLTAGEVTATVFWIGGREITLEGAGYLPQGGFFEKNHPIEPLQDPVVAQVLRAVALANRADLHRVGEEWIGRGDPTELALLVAAAKAGLHRPTLHDELPEVAEVPFSSERRWMATVHRNPATNALHTHVKGAAANVLSLCSRIWLPDGVQPLDAARRKIVLDTDAELAGRGLRVLAVAAGPVSGGTEQDIRDLEFIGLIGLIDPPAPGVKETIATFRQAGIRTVMITGDQKRTAEAVAGMLDMLRAADQIIDGVQLEQLSDEQLMDRLPRTAAFSRITPDAKLRLVGAYQRRGDIVAMIGDGINDAAALRKADIGVAMGRRGTDVAKEAAAVVLQDDRFQTIGVAIQQGRVIFDNIRKFVFYLFSCNLAEMLVLLGAGAAGLPLPLLPLQILWLNLVTDTFPALALAVEPGEPAVLQRAPRNPQQAIMSRRFLRSVFFYAALITAASLGAFLIGLRYFPAQAATMAFMTLALAQTFHLGTARSTGHVLGRHAFTNRTAFGAVLLVVLLQLATLYYAPLAQLLRTVPLHGPPWLVVAVMSVLPAIVGQSARLFRR